MCQLVRSTMQHGKAHSGKCCSRQWWPKTLSCCAALKSNAQTAEPVGQRCTLVFDCNLVFVPGRSNAACVTVTNNACLRTQACVNRASGWATQYGTHWPHLRKFPCNSVPYRYHNVASPEQHQSPRSRYSAEASCMPATARHPRSLSHRPDLKHPAKALKMPLAPWMHRDTTTVKATAVQQTTWATSSPAVFRLPPVIP
jgi:hypothetical protein